MSLSFTQKLRLASVWCWSFGMGAAAADKLAFSFLQQQISLGYLFFSLAFFLCLWAEKREFSTRIALYRLHDVAIYGPWKFLLLYFLWESIFLPFTNEPLKSILYGLGGWFSLLAVGFSAELIFCERSVRGSVFVPERLRIVFSVYAVAMIVLFASLTVRLFIPSIPDLNHDPVNLFLYFVLGFPFLFWDFHRRSRRLLPRKLSGLALFLGTLALVTLGHLFFLASILFLSIGVAALAVYKRVRFRPVFLSFLIMLVLSAFALLGIHYVAGLNVPPLVLQEIQRLQSAVTLRMENSVSSVWEILLQTKFLGSGIGLSDYKGVWTRVLTETGVVGFALYLAFFLDLLYGLYRIRHATRLVVSNIALISVLYFLLLGSHFLANPYGAYIWCWYSIWAVFSAYYRKQEVAR